MEENQEQENIGQTSEQAEAPDQEKQARMWGMLCHLTSLIAFLGIPLGHLLGPLVVWLLKKNEFEYVDKQGKEALNFQISITIYAMIAAVLVLLLIGIPILVLLVVADLVLVIMASVKANNGEDYQYPATIRFIK